MDNKSSLCGMGYPSQGLPCVRPKGHDWPLSPCFAITSDGKGVYLYQDGKEWCKSQKEWPEDVK